MRTALSKMLTLVILFGLTSVVLLTWLGVTSTARRAALPQTNSISVRLAHGF